MNAKAVEREPRSCGRDGRRGAQAAGAPPALAQRRGAVGGAFRRPDRRSRLDHRGADFDRPVHRTLARSSARHRYFLERGIVGARRHARILVGLEMDAQAMTISISATTHRWRCKQAYG